MAIELQKSSSETDGWRQEHYVHCFTVYDDYIHFFDLSILFAFCFVHNQCNISITDIMILILFPFFTIYLHKAIAQRIWHGYT